MCRYMCRNILKAVYVACLILAYLVLGASRQPVRADFLWSNPPDQANITSLQRNNVFYVGQPVTFSVSGTAARYEVRDYYGALVDQGACAPTLRVNVAAPGWYKLYLYRAASIAPWGTAVGGTTFVIFRNDPHFPALPDKSTQNQWGSGANDEIMRGVTGMGPQRYSIPDASNPTAAIASIQANIAQDQQYYLPFDPLRKRALMVSFPNGTTNTAGVRQVVSALQNQVTYWEGMNEPMFTYGSAATYLSTEGIGFYQTIKSVNPNLKVIGPSLVTAGPFGLNWLADFFKSGGASYIDDISFHAYNNVNGDPWLARTSMDTLNQYLSYYGVPNMEKWQTEQSYAAANYGVYTPRHQGRWTMMQRLIFEQYGIPKEHDVIWQDMPGYWDYPYFYENDDGSLNPMAALIRVWSEELYGTTFAQKLDFGPTGNNQFLGSLYSGPGKSVAAFMSAGGTDGQVTLQVTGGSSLHVVSAFGQASDLPVVGGQVSLPVPGEPVYVELASGQTIQAVPLNWGADLALYGGTASSSAGPDTSISKIINGQLENWYWNQQPTDVNWAGSFPGDGAWVQIALPSVQTIDHVVVYAASPWQALGTLLDYELQYDAGGGRWMTIDHVQEPTKTVDAFTPVTHTTVDSYFSDRWVFQHHFSPVTTSRIRLLVHNVTYGGGADADVAAAAGSSGITGSQAINLREVEVYNSTAQTAFRINCGGQQYTSATAGTYQGDADFNGGSTWSYYSPTVTGTSDPSLYTMVRYSQSSFSYTLPAVPGAYTLKLHFFEGDPNVRIGSRLFNVSVNGAPALTNFDVFAAGGGVMGKAVDQILPVTAGANGVTVSFQTAKNSPYSAMVSAIELIPGVTPPASPAGLTATSGNGQASLAWSAVPGAAGYSVYRGTSAGAESATPVATGLTALGYTDTGLTNGTQYYYTVTATGPGGESPPSNEASATPTASGTATLRINSGGGAYTDTLGNAWQADTDYTGGNTWSYQTLAISGTADPSLYRDVRYSAGAFGYTLPAAPGTYTLKLHFVEGDPGVRAGSRLFSVLVNGAAALTNLDVFATAGGTGKALDESVPVTVPTGGSGVTVSFQAVNSSAYTAMISALELIPTAGPATPTVPAAPSGLTAAAGSGQVVLAWSAVTGATSYSVYRGTSAGGEGATPVATGLTIPSDTDTGLTNGTTYYYTVTAVGPGGEGAKSTEASATPRAAVVAAPALRINSGGGAYTDTLGNAWQADADYTGGDTWTYQGLSVAGTANPSLYRDVRYSAGTFGYTLPAAPGAYTLKLHFVEGDGQAQTPGFRTFNVLVNGATTLTNLDVCAQAGGLGKPLDESLPVTVPAGGSSVTVSFQSVHYTAMVSAIELVPAGSP